MWPGTRGAQASVAGARPTPEAGAWGTKGLSRKASHVATGSHQGHFTRWAKIQCSNNSNIYSHFLNTGLSSPHISTVLKQRVPYNQYQNKFGEQMEEKNF